MEDGDWSGRRESNPRHQAWEACVLPLNYSRSSPSLAGLHGRSYDLIDLRKIAGLSTRVNAHSVDPTMPMIDDSIDGTRLSKTS